MGILDGPSTTLLTPSPNTNRGCYGTESKMSLRGWGYCKPPTQSVLTQVEGRLSMMGKSTATPYLALNQCGWTDLVTSPPMVSVLNESSSVPARTFAQVVGDLPARRVLEEVVTNVAPIVKLNMSKIANISVTSPAMLQKFTEKTTRCLSTYFSNQSAPIEESGNKKPPAKTLYIDLLKRLGCINS